MTTVISIAIAVALVAELVFLLGYLRVPWYRSAEGRMVMATDLVVIAVLCLAFIGAFYPDLPGRQAIRFFTWSAIASVFVWKTILFHMRQAQGRRARRDQQEKEEADEILDDLRP